MKKTNFIFFHSSKNSELHIDLKIFDKDTTSLLPLEQKEKIKYLGVLIDSNLTWKYHLGFITAKTSKSIGIVARLRHCVPTSTLSQFFGL